MPWRYLKSPQPTLCLIYIQHTGYHNWIQEPTFRSLLKSSFELLNVSRLLMLEPGKNGTICSSSARRLILNYSCINKTLKRTYAFLSTWLSSQCLHIVLYFLHSYLHFKILSFLFQLWNLWKLAHQSDHLWQGLSRRSWLLYRVAEML